MFDTLYSLVSADYFAIKSHCFKAFYSGAAAVLQGNNYRFCFGYIGLSLLMPLTSGLKPFLDLGPEQKTAYLTQSGPTNKNADSSFRLSPRIRLVAGTGFEPMTFGL